MQKLNTPVKMQDFLSGLKFNFEEKRRNSEISGDGFKNTKCPLFEGAILGAYILSLHGFPPLILHLQTTGDDFDHVITPFKQHGLWGALSKTNHAVLRYREPIYKNIHELAVSYFQ